MGIRLNQPSVDNILPFINDGNTVAWYDYTDTATVIKTDSSVSQWKDKSGMGNDLLSNSNGATWPRWDPAGIIFDGINDYLKTLDFTWNQPETAYIVVKQLSWTASDMIWDGKAPNLVHLIQVTSSPNIAISGGAANLGTTDLSIGVWGVVKSCTNGVNSTIRVNNLSINTGNSGIFNAGGFTLGGRGDGLANFANIQVKEIILRNVVDDLAKETVIYNYFNAKYNITANTSKIKMGLASYPSVLYDGNTVGWYDYNDLNTISKTIDSSVTKWKDKLNSGRDLSTGVVSSSWPVWSPNGIIFDGVNDFIRGTFTYVQPEHIYAVLKLSAWTLNAVIWDGTVAQGGYLQLRTSSPTIGILAGSTPLLNYSLTLDSFVVIRALYNGGSSRLGVNSSISVTGPTIGSNNLGGFTIGANGSSTPAGFTNVTVKELILRNTADSAATENSIYSYLSTKYNIASPIFSIPAKLKVGSASYPSVLYDGNTVAWYDYSDATAITKSVDSSVSRWGDKSGNHYDLSSSTNLITQPKWTSDGLLFDGVNDYMRSVPFTLNQPVYMYVVANQATYNGGTIVSGLNEDTYAQIYKPGTVSPRIALSAPTYNCQNDTMVLDKFHILRAFFNGASSSLQSDTSTKTLGSVGTAGLNGVMLAKYYTTYSNIKYKEIIIRSGPDSTATENSIYTYLSNKHNIK